MSDAEELVTSCDYDEDETKQTRSSDEAEESVEVRGEETEMTRQSQVYSATTDTLFSKSPTRTHALVSMFLLIY